MGVFAQRLRQIKEEKNLSVYAMADVCRVSGSTINAYLHGRTTPTLAVAIDLAKWLGTTVGWLCGETEEMNADKQP